MNRVLFSLLRWLQKKRIPLLFLFFFVFGFLFSSFLTRLQANQLKVNTIHLENPKTEHYLEQFKSYYQKEKGTNSEKLDLAIFIHVGIFGKIWKNALDTLIHSIRESGLLGATKYAFLCANGDISMDFLQEYSDFYVVQLTNDATEMEFPTLKFLHAFSSALPHFKVLYLHNKGASHDPVKDSSFGFLQDWIQLMLYFNVKHWSTMIQHLETHDVACVNVLHQPFLHCSGNFWWARADHIAASPHPYTLFAPFHRFPKMNAESYVGFRWRNIDTLSQKKKLCCVFNSGIVHYWYPYPAIHYNTIESFSCLES